MGNNLKGFRKTVASILNRFPSRSRTQLRQENETVNAISLLSDSPATEDELEYHSYSEAIVSVINGLPTGISLTIGVFGEWGSGKTTLLQFVQDGLRKSRIHTIWVDIWQFGNEEDVWAAFLQSILLKVRSEATLIRRTLFHIGLIRHQVNYTLLAKKLPEWLLRTMLVVIPMYLTLSNITLPDQATRITFLQIAWATGSIFSIVLGWFLLVEPYLKEVQKRVNIDLSDLIKSSPLKDRISRLDQFKSYFHTLLISLVGQEGKVVFIIDDLDRCPPDKIVQVLDAVKVFLDVPNCIYMIGLDREITHQAIAKKFDKYKEPNRQASEYLEKIIGLPFDLPPLSEAQMANLVSKIGSNLPNTETAKVFAFGHDANPRKVKRAINVFLFLWALARNRPSIASKIQPVRLAKIVVIQHSYRELFSIIKVFPRYLSELEIYFRQIDYPTSTTTSEHVDIDSVGLPEVLQAFAKNDKLKRLLTMHPNGSKDTSLYCFTELRRTEHKPISEDDIKTHISFTTTVSNPLRSTESRLPLFINREKELALFLDVMDREKSQQIVLIQSPAGMGKTFLLTHFAYIVRERGMTDQIAFVHLRSASDPVNLMQNVVFDLSPDGFGNFRDALQQNALEQSLMNVNMSMEDPVDSSQSIQIDDSVASYLQQARIENLSHAFLIDLQKATSQGRGLILIDDLETATDEMAGWISRYLLDAIIQQRLPNLIVVLSGRNIPPIITEDTSEDSFIMFLNSFSKADAQEFINRSGLEIDVSDILSIADTPLALALLIEILKVDQDDFSKSDELNKEKE